MDHYIAQSLLEQMREANKHAKVANEIAYQQLRATYTVAGINPVPSTTLAKTLAKLNEKIG